MAMILCTDAGPYSGVCSTYLRGLTLFAASVCLIALPSIATGDAAPPLVVDAHFRGVRHDELGQLSAAIQFVGLELSVDGRLVLQRLAACVQKFHRLSFISGVRHWNRPTESP